MVSLPFTLLSLSSLPPSLPPFLPPSLPTAKKNLAPSAVAGLSIKLDFTTVKLRKTGISDKMLMEKSTDISKDLPNFAVGAEYDTKHTTILLQIKGTYTHTFSISTYVLLACTYFRSLFVILSNPSIGRSLLRTRKYTHVI